jgi:Kef-type K+ transport system membrane component KefB
VDSRGVALSSEFLADSQQVELVEQPVSAVRKAVFYTAMVIAPAAVVVFLLFWAGAPVTSGASGGWRFPALPSLARLLLTLTAIVAVTRIAGGVSRRLGQPAVIGEIAGGIVLGPSVLQAIWPQLGSSLFAPSVMSNIDVLAQVGVVLFVFVAGLELRPSALAGRASTLAVIGHAGMIIPLLCGTLFGIVGYSSLASSGVGIVPFALFIGLAISITALPVLARILEERNLTGTSLGSVVLTCAAMNDVIAWCVLALVLALAGVGSITATITTTVFTVVMIVALLVLGVWLHRSSGATARKILSSSVGTVLVAVLLAAVISDWGGLDTVFGAFLLGVAIPAESVVARRFQAASGLLQPLLLSVFFAASGLRTDITQLGSDPTLWEWCVLVLLVATVAKVGATAMGARAVGIGWRDSVRVGGLMNCRGLTEIIVLNIGLDVGIIDVKVFTIFVIMALVSTAATGFFVRGIRSKEILV